MSTGDSTQTRWVLDRAQSTAEFRVPTFWGLVNVKGHFDRVDGWLEIDETGPRRLEFVIDAASLNTGNLKRDEHLRSADFFDTEQHPDVQFVSSEVSDADDGRLHVEGELVAVGNRVPLTLEPTLRQVDDRIDIEADATVDQRKLGMTWSPLGMTRTPTTLTVHARLVPDR